MGMKDYLYLEADGTVKSELEDLYVGDRYLSYEIYDYKVSWGGLANLSHTWWLAYQTGRTKLSGEANVKAIPGKVIYERIISVTSKPVTDPVKYKSFDNNTVKVDTIEFNFGIESMVPPTKKKGAGYRTSYLTEYKPGQPTPYGGRLIYNTEGLTLINNSYEQINNTSTSLGGWALYDGPYIENTKFIRERSYNYDNYVDPFFKYYDNDVIDKITVSIRYTIDTNYNAWEKNNYVELGTIEIPTNILSPAQRENLNDTNRRKWDIDRDSFKGYGDNTIKIVSDGCTKEGTFWYLNSESERRPIKWVTNIPEDSRQRIIFSQGINPDTLLKGYIYGEGVLPVYYLTIVPEVDPIEWNSSGGLSNNTNYPSGYIELNLCVPMFSDETWNTPSLNVIYNGIGVGEEVEKNLVSKWVFANKVKRFGREKWWGATKIPMEHDGSINSNIPSYNADTDFTNYKSPAYWIHIARKKYLKDYVNDGKKYINNSFSDKDKLLPSWVFRTYGINTIRDIIPFMDFVTTVEGYKLNRPNKGNKIDYTSYGSQESGYFDGVIKVSANDDIWRLPKGVLKWIVAEFHAWFRPTNQNSTSSVSLDTISILSKAVSYEPIMKRLYTRFRDIPNDTNNKKVEISGGFHYKKIDFYQLADIQPQLDSLISQGKNTEADAIGQEFITKFRGYPKIWTDIPKSYGIVWRRSDQKDWTNVVFSDVNNPLAYSDYVKDLTNYEPIAGGTIKQPTRQDPYTVTPLGYTGLFPIVELIEDRKPTSTAGNWRMFSFEYNLPNLPNGLSYEVYFWVETYKSASLSSDSSELEKLYTKKNKIFFKRVGTIVYGLPTFDKFTKPEPGLKPFWFQMYNGWRINEKPISGQYDPYNDINPDTYGPWDSSTNKYLDDFVYYRSRYSIIPFYSRNNIWDGRGQYNSASNYTFMRLVYFYTQYSNITEEILDFWKRYRPFHYYHNKIYKEGKNYQFRIVVENYFGSLQLKNKDAKTNNGSKQHSWQGIEALGYHTGYKKDPTKDNLTANTDVQSRAYSNDPNEPHKMMFDLFDLWSDEPILPNFLGFYKYYKLDTNGNITYSGSVQENYILSDKDKKFKTEQNAINYKNGVEYDDTSILYKTTKPMKLVTPWSDFIDMNPPIVPVEVFRGGNIVDNANYEDIRKMNLYGYANINSFNEDNIRKNYIAVSASNTFSLSELPTKPLTSFESSYLDPKNPLTITADMYFNGFSKVIITECEWEIQGYATFNMMTATDINDINDSQIIEYKNTGLGLDFFTGRGWHYIDDTLIWVDYVNDYNDKKKNDVSINTNFPMGGSVFDYYSDKKSHIKYLYNNFAAKLITYERYNLTFDYVNSSNFGLTMYIGTELPEEYIYYNNIDSLIESGKIYKVGTLAKSVGTQLGLTQSCEFIGLKGNQYLFFVADTIVNFNKKIGKDVVPGDDWRFALTTTNAGYGFKSGQNYVYKFSNGNKGKSEKCIISISNFKLQYSYEESVNNKQVSVSGNNYSEMGNNMKGLTFSVKFGFGNNVFKNSPNGITTIGTKVGNGSFVSGIWESGVWNSGWRDDITIMDFFAIKEFYGQGGSWYIRISGPSESVDAFSVGDKVSIGNIIAINDNEKRVLLKEYYQINAVDKTIGYVEVKVDYNFPLMRFEMDSDEHRIRISKNIWLDGVFLNGYFRGIWNDGLFNGQPMQTLMDRSNWIDGIFNGGHFYADKKSIIFSYVEKVIKDDVPRLKLKFVENHRLNIDDVISIEFYTTKAVFGGLPVNDSSLGIKLKDDEPYHLGTTVIIDIDDKSITTGIIWNNEYLNITAGKIYTTISTGLIQNFEFYSNNVSNITSLQSLKSERVFQYNSWIDVNYSDQSAVNIGRPLTFVDPVSGRQYPENNLYGYPTTDVITSLSIFRDSYSSYSRRYELGSRYEIFSDLVGSSSNFDEHFESTDTQQGRDMFGKQGWDYKISPSSTKYLKSANAKIDYNNNILELRFVGTEGGNNEYASSFTNGQILNIESYVLLLNEYNTRLHHSQTIIVDSALDTPNYAVVNLIGATPSLPNNEVAVWSISDKFIISFDSKPGLTYSRTIEPLSSDSKQQGKELRIDATEDGGTLDLVPVDDIPKRTNGTQERTLTKNRYSMVEFKIVDKKTKYDYHQNSEGYILPLINFGNLNFVNRDVTDYYGIKTEKLLKTLYLPVYDNVNHINTHGNKKQEFFFNKQNLSLNIKGNGVLGINKSEIMLDDLKMYEVSRVPFFQYFKSMSKSSIGNINITIQMPKTTENIGTAPFIEFSDVNAIDNSNSVKNFFISKLVITNVPVPESINWEKDYIIYRRQISDLSTPEYYYDSNLSSLKDSSGYIIIKDNDNTTIVSEDVLGSIDAEIAASQGNTPTDLNNNNKSE